MLGRHSREAFRWRPLVKGALSIYLFVDLYLHHFGRVSRSGIRAWCHRLVALLGLLLKWRVCVFVMCTQWFTKQTRHYFSFNIDLFLIQIFRTFTIHLNIWYFFFVLFKYFIAAIHTFFRIRTSFFFIFQIIFKMSCI